MDMVSGIGKLLKNSEPVLTINAESTVCQAARKMARHDVGCLLVVDGGGALVGIVTERDVIAKVVGVKADASQVPVADICTRRVVSCATDTPLGTAQELMAHNGIRHLPILDAGRPVGMVSSRDILAHQLSSVEAVARRQLRVIRQLEEQHPGITNVQRDRAGRLVI